MKRYMKTRKMMWATCTQKELDLIVEAYKEFPQYTLLHSDFSAFVGPGLAAVLLDKSSLNADDVDMIGLSTFLRQLDDAGVMGVFLKVQLSEGDA